MLPHKGAKNVRRHAGSRRPHMLRWKTAIAALLTLAMWRLPAEMGPNIADLPRLAQTKLPAAAID